MPGRKGITLVLCAALAACSGAAPVAQRANRPMAAGSIVGAQSPLWDTPASLVSGDAPVYPINEFLTGGEGHAEVEFTVTREGATRDITVISARRPAFGRHLAAAVRGWRFEPARMDGLAVPSTLRIEFDFSIDRGYNAPPSPRDREYQRERAGGR